MSVTISREQDPDSDRLDLEQVIHIHKQHLAGVGWSKIAEDVGTSRKNVQRIVQGRRWAKYHPVNAPHLYGAAPDASARPAMTIYLDTVAGRIARAAYDQAIKELPEAAPAR